MAVKLVGVMIDGKRTIHAPSHGHGCYDTLCGLDANDPVVGHTGTFEPHETKFIDCAACYTIWKKVEQPYVQRINIASNAQEGAS